MAIDLTSWSSVVSSLVSSVVMILVVFLQRVVAQLSMKDHKRHRTVKRLLIGLGSVLSNPSTPRRSQSDCSIPTTRSGSE